MKARLLCAFVLLVVCAATGCQTGRTSCNFCRPGTQCNGTNLVTCFDGDSSTSQVCTNGCVNDSATTAHCNAVTFGTLCNTSEGIIACPGGTTCDTVRRRCVTAGGGIGAVCIGVKGNVIPCD